METKYMQGFDDFIAEDKAADPEDEQRANANLIWELIDSGENFGFICSSRGIDNAKTNDERLNNLEEDIIRSKCAYVRFRYGYGYPEGGCIVRRQDMALFVSGMKLEELLELGRKYEQEVVVYGDKHAIQSFQISDGKPDVILEFPEMRLAMCTILFFPGTFRGR